MTWHALLTLLEALWFWVAIWTEQLSKIENLLSFVNLSGLDGWGFTVGLCFQFHANPQKSIHWWLIDKITHTDIIDLFFFLCRYMKYLYPYECEKRGLSSPGELQAAIDSNRREGRRQSYGSAIFNYSPVGTPTLLSSPKIQMSHLPVPTHNSGHISQVPVIKKGKVTQ